MPSKCTTSDAGLDYLKAKPRRDGVGCRSKVVQLGQTVTSKWSENNTVGLNTAVGIISPGKCSSAFFTEETKRSVVLILFTHFYHERHDYSYCSFLGCASIINLTRDNSHKPLPKPLQITCPYTFWWILDVQVLCLPE